MFRFDEVSWAGIWKPHTPSEFWLHVALACFVLLIAPFSHQSRIAVGIIAATYVPAAAFRVWNKEARRRRIEERKSRTVT